MGAQHALGRAPRTRAEIDSTLVALVDKIARRLRAARRVCRTVMLRLRFDDFTRATRSHTLNEATARTPTILRAVRELLAAAMPLIEEKGITLVGITLGNLENDDAVQLAFPFERASALDTALDDVRERFGTAAIKRAVLIGKDERPSVPLLPD
jgi:DNA polymerase-4